MPLLWKIEKNGQKPSYLFGSVHVASPDMQFLNPFYTIEFQQADKVVFECDLKKVIDETIEEDQKHLFSVLDPEVQALIINHLKGFKSANELNLMPMSAVLRACAIACLPDKEKYSLDFDQVIDSGMDARLYHEALKKNKEIAAFESQEKIAEYKKLFQFNDHLSLASLLAELTKNEWEAVLAKFNCQSQSKARMIADGFDSGHSLMLDVFNVYLTQDIEKIKSTTNDIPEALLEQRNQAWMDPMLAMLNEGKSNFFVVGAAHLGGEAGLIELLKKEKFTVTPVVNYTTQLPKEPLNLHYSSMPASKWRARLMREASYFIYNKLKIRSLLSNPLELKVWGSLILSHHKPSNSLDIMMYSETKVPFNMFEEWKKSTNIDEKISHLFDAIQDGIFNNQGCILALDHKLADLNRLILELQLARRYFMNYKPNYLDYCQFFQSNDEYLIKFSQNPDQHYLLQNEQAERTAKYFVHFLKMAAEEKENQDTRFDFIGTRLDLDDIDDKFNDTLADIHSFEWAPSRGSLLFDNNEQTDYDFPLQLNSSLKSMRNLEQIKIARPGIDRELIERTSMSNLKSVEVQKYNAWVEKPRPPVTCWRTFCNIYGRVLSAQLNFFMHPVNSLQQLYQTDNNNRMRMDKA